MGKQLTIEGVFTVVDSKDNVVGVFDTIAEADTFVGGFNYGYCLGYTERMEELRSKDKEGSDGQDDKN